MFKRHLVRASADVAALTSALLLSACVPAGGPQASPSAPGPMTDLTITQTSGAAGGTWHLTCQPSGGDHPDPAGACQALQRSGAAALAEVPPSTACTQIYGGPQTATVTGTRNGEPVNARFKRTNGCEIARWDSLVPLLPKPGR